VVQDFYGISDNISYQSENHKALKWGFSIHPKSQNVNVPSFSPENVLKYNLFTSDMKQIGVGTAINMVPV